MCCGEAQILWGAETGQADKLCLVHTALQGLQADMHLYPLT